MSKASLSITQEVATKTDVDVYFTDYFNVDPDVLEQYGAFNISLVTDLPLFIDPFLLFNSENPQYRKLHDNIIKYLRFLKDKSLTQTIDSGALKAWYTFREVEQNWLGFSAIGNRGSGLGTDFAQALNENLVRVFDTPGQRQVTRGSHLEKLCLIKEGVGRDNISDFTTNLIKGFLLEYTQTFARQYISHDLRAIFRVARVYFNYVTESWEERTYELPKFGKSFVILTPKALLTKDDTWINKEDLIRDFDQIPTMIDNDELRFKINNYFLSQLSLDSDRAGKKPTKKERAAAAAATLRQFPSEIIDYYIKLKEDHGEQATSISGEKVAFSEGLFIANVQRFMAGLQKTGFYLPTDNSFEEARRKIVDLKGYIENNDGYRLFYHQGQRIHGEKELQLLFGLICHNSTLSDVNREPNNGRGPVDATLSRGRLDKTLVEFKLASNRKLEQNLRKQVEIYQRANGTQFSFKVIVYFSEDELLKVSTILNKLGLAGNPQIILIDARNDNKPSASNA
jgi:hypothetical protein